MAFNIMDMITDQITPDNIGLLSKFLGEDSSLVSKAVSAAAPMLLSGILGSTAKPQGRDLFNQTIDKADTGLLGNLAGALTGSGGSSLASSGVSILTSLLGDNTLGSLVKALTGFGGMSSNSSKSLLGIAAPMLMSMLSKKKQDDGLDNSGLLSMLTGQKKNIANAITPDMSKAFSGLGIMDSLTDQAGDTVKAAAQSVSDTAQQAATESKSLFSKLLPYIIIALLVWLAYQFFMKPGQEEAVSPSAVQTEQTMMDAMTVDNKNLGKILVETFDQANKALSGVTDADSANAAMNSLAEVNQHLDGITRLASQLSPEGRQMLSTIVNKMSSGLDQTIDKVYQVPGAGNILGNSINTLRQQLTALANL